ncbi:MAG: acylneuraminate cytidylyltransferase family protein [Deltaproteobacteria bacterium]|nr:acylneuraminate cytidylyltransferase family protein [Deltaproteobacteria bacterium]
MRVLGVIPARGGSKGVPRKNIRKLGDRPLIGHTIAAALASRLARTVLTTDDEEIAAVGRSLGAEVPFMRPAELASDSARAIPVIQHALATLEAAGDHFDAVMMLQPTTPFRRTEDIDGALALLEKTGADSVISVVDTGGHHPARMKFLDGDRLIDPPYCEAYENQPRQELTPMYLRNGAIYLTRRDVIMAGAGSFKGRDCRAWIMPASRSVNIDNELEFRQAEWLLAEGLVK